jgi:chromosome segregation ATPase
MLNNWLTISSVAFGVSCGCTLPFTQNLAQSALIGLATMPGVAASAIVRSRQRQRQVNRQLERGRVRLDRLQQRGEVLTEQLQHRSKDCQAIELRVAQLHSLAASLTDRTHRDRLAIAQLEQKLAAIALYDEDRQALATKLDRKIQDKQARSLEVDTNFNSLKLEKGSLDESIDRQRLVLQELDLVIIERQKTHQDIAAEVERVKSENLQELISQQQRLADIQLQSIETELGLQIKQVQLDDLAAEKIVRYKEIEGFDRDLKITRLELSSKQAELDNLDLKIQTKLRSIDEIDLDLAKSLQTFEPQSPTIFRDIDNIILSGEWYDKFIDNPHLSVLQHIEKHGTITEAEASSKLGNARSVRQFANKLAEYTPDLPFSIRVESSPKGNRYLKEDRN